jgi:hypothetical protein
VCGVAGWFGRIVVVAGAVVVLGASGCTSDGTGPVDPPAPSSAASVTPTPSPSGTAEEQILAQYRRFWTEALPAAQAASDARNRSRILEAVVMEPALHLLVGGMAMLDREGRKPYGRDIPLHEVVERQGDTALVTGCLDSSHAGVADRATGEKLTVGVPNNPVFVTLKRDHDAVWRVFGTRFPGGRRC